MSKDTRHLVRAGALLVVGVVVFLLIRQVLVPRSFGEYGYYRGENVQEWASLPLTFSDTSSCNQCHAPVYAQWHSSPHVAVSCENCHGPGIAHIETGAKLTIPEARELCLVCHERLFSRPANFPQVESVAHAGDVECTACHSPHSPAIGGTPPASQTPTAGQTPIATDTGPTSAFPLIPHPLEGRATCSLCHRVEAGLVPLSQSHAGRTDDICLACHQQRKP
ncbi:MAG: hypothetical protein HY676_04155 [Chloroflexi bacterium]|nr:hypothetical protein [Chloroflexota bacterium]